MNIWSFYVFLGQGLVHFIINSEKRFCVIVNMSGEEEENAAELKIGEGNNT